MSRRHDPRHDHARLGRLLAPRRRPNPLVLAWRWRYELCAALVLLGVGALLTGAIGVWLTVAVASLVVGVVTGWDPLRRRAAALGWCVVTEHRLRRGLFEAWAHTRDGRVPSIVWCVPVSYGERAVLWCPAGVTVDHLVSARAVLADACYAITVEIARHPRWRHLAVVAVVRRGPAGRLSAELDGTRDTGAV